MALCGVASCSVVWCSVVCRSAVRTLSYVCVYVFVCLLCMCVYKVRIYESKSEIIGQIKQFKDDLRPTHARAQMHTHTQSQAADATGTYACAQTYQNTL